jgi:transposase
LPLEVTVEGMLGMTKRHEIQVLLEAGHTQAAIVAAAGVSRRSVQRVGDEPRVTTFDDRAERARRRIGRPSKAEPLRDFLAAELAADPDRLGVELLWRAKQRGYAGGKSALYALLRELRVLPVRPVVRFEGLPGEFSQHDFGQVDVRFVDGRVRRIHFFASRLKYSRTVQVSIVEDERVESLLRSLVAHLDAFGGVPLFLVFDRPKTIAVEWSRKGEVTKWNDAFADVMLTIGANVELCWPYSPEQKGSVENLVGWVKGSFFKQRCFVDEEDLSVQLVEWLRVVNDERPSRATKTVPAVRLAEERPRLRPLRIRPEELTLRIPIVVRPEGKVIHEARSYSMPPETKGKAGTLYLGRDHVRIVVADEIAVHPRLRGTATVSELPHHRVAHVEAARGARARLYVQREHLRRLGRDTEAFLTELVHRRPRTWGGDVERMHDLLLRHGDVALANAARCALDAGVYGSEYVAYFLGGSPAAEVSR